MTSGGGWLSVGLDPEAIVVSQTADRRRGAGVNEFLGEFENHGARKKRDLQKIYLRQSFQVKWHGCVHRIIDMGLIRREKSFGKIFDKKVPDLRVFRHFFNFHYSP